MKLRVKELRKDKGVSQIELATAIDSNQQSITDWELYKKVPRLEVLIAMADYFGVSLDYLVGRSDVPYFVKSYAMHDGEVVCFTTEKPSDEYVEGPSDEKVVRFSIDPDALPTNRQELEQLVESLVRKVVSKEQ